MLDPFVEFVEYDGATLAVRLSDIIRLHSRAPDPRLNNSSCIVNIRSSFERYLKDTYRTALAKIREAEDRVAACQRREEEPVENLA